MARLMMVGIRLNFPAWEKRLPQTTRAGPYSEGDGAWTPQPWAMQGRQAGLGYLSVHNDVNADPVGLDKCASGAAIYLVILGKPGTA